MSYRWSLLLALMVLLAGVSPTWGMDEGRSFLLPLRQPPQDTLRDDPRVVILDQPEAPVSLTTYEANYAGIRLFQSDGIRHDVAFQNEGDRRIVAFKLTFVMYSVFNDPIGTTNGVYLDPLAPGTNGSESWTHDPPNASTFHVGAAYVEKVRYANGEIWSADSSTVDQQLTRIDRRGKK